MSEDFTATQMSVQLLGAGSVVLFSVSKTPDMNVNFVVGAAELVTVMREIVGKATEYPDSPLGRIGIFRRKQEEEKAETDPVTA